MDNLFQTMEATAERGAEGLTPQAREALAAAVRALQQSDGGFAGLDGRSDLYYSFFAWLSLRALKASFNCEQLCSYAVARGREAQGVDARCAEILLVREGRRSRAAGWMAVAGALLRGGALDMYGAFLLALAIGEVPRVAARLAWRRTRRLFESDAAKRLPTPRLAAGLIQATLAGECGTGLLPVLSARQCRGGGFASAEGAAADLLATAVARFAWRCSAEPAHRIPGEAQKDMAFIEACWLEDGLFGASPAALHGDAEHTFYALLALGTCR